MSIREPNFFGLELRPGHSFTQVPPTVINVTMAALVAEDEGKGSSGNKPVVLKTTVDDEDFVLAVLRPGVCENINLNLLFAPGEPVSFKIEGKGRVYLTGYTSPQDGVMHPDDDDSDLEDDSDDDDDDDDDDEDGPEFSLDDIQGLKEYLMSGGVRRASKKAQLALQDAKGGDDDDDDDESSEDEDYEPASDDDDDADLAAMLARGPASDEDVSDVSDDDGDSSDGDEEGDEDSDEEDTDDEEARRAANGKRRAPAGREPPSKKAKADAAAAQAEQKRKEQAEAAAKKKKQLQEAEKKKQQQEAEKKKQQQEAEKKKQQQQQQPGGKQGSGVSKTLPGGLRIVERVIGKGKPVRPGKQLVMGYKGQLMNGKVFDKSANFKFRFGIGEVIKGWDKGLVGMKEGGKRQLTIPAAMGYGKRGAPPDIPGNATLVFEVEVKKVL